MLYCRFRRIESGKTQRQVARAARLNFSILSQIETGQLVPRDGKLARLARVLDCPVDRLLLHIDESSLGSGAEFRDARRS